MNVAGLFKAPDGLAGEDGTARRPASGCIAEGVGETQALSGDAVEGWCLNHGVTVGAGVGVTLVIRDTEKDVGSTLSLSVSEKIYNQDCREEEEVVFHVVVFEF